MSCMFLHRGTDFVLWVTPKDVKFLVFSNTPNTNNTCYTQGEQCVYVVSLYFYETLTRLLY